MVRTIRARFSKGVFWPLEPDVAKTLQEGDEVLITVSTSEAVESADPLVDSAGGWRGLVDAEALKRQVYADLQSRVLPDGGGTGSLRRRQPELLHHAG
jgi:predicted DNA-binding antitoxin AbrB/MazE fold protein